MKIMPLTANPSAWLLIRQNCDNSVIAEFTVTKDYTITIHKIYLDKLVNLKVIAVIFLHSTVSKDYNC